MQAFTTHIEYFIRLLLLEFTLLEFVVVGKPSTTIEPSFMVDKLEPFRPFLMLEVNLPLDNYHTMFRRNYAK